MGLIILLLASVLLIVLIFLMRNIKWVVKEVRSVCENESGYVKLMQLAFVTLIFGSFSILLIYNLFFKEITSKLDIFLTVVVGLMGTIVGTFFSERSMESIKQDRDRKKKAAITTKKKLEQYNQLVNKLVERLSK